MLRVIPSCLTLVVSTALAAIVLDAAARADDKPGSKKERRDHQRVREAQDALEAAKADLAAAENRLAAAARKYQAAQQQQHESAVRVQLAKEKAEERLERSTGLQQAIGDYKTAQRDLERLAAPLRDKLKQQPEYQAALSAAELARSRLLTIHSDAGLSDAEIKAQVQIIHHTLQAPARLEQAAIEADGPARQAQERLLATQRRVAELREKFRERIESDREVQAALLALQQANKQLDAAEQALASARPAVARAKQSAQDAFGRLQAAKAADRANDKDNNKNGRKGK